MGLLGALGAGIGAAAEYGAEGMMSKMKAEIEQQKQEALLMMKEQMDIRGEERKEGREKPLRDLQIGNEKLKQEGLINQRVTEGIQLGTMKEGQMADGSFVSVGDDGVVRRLNKDGTPMTAARGKDGSIAGTDAKTYGMDAKEKLQIQATEAQIASSRTSAGNASLERELKTLALDEAKKQKDPAATALVTQAMQQLDSGDRKGAMKSLKTASDHYGNKAAAELLIKIATTPGESSTVETTTAPDGTVLERKETSKSKGPVNKPVSGGKPMPWDGAWKVN